MYKSVRLQSRKTNKHVLADLCALIRGSFYQMIGVQAIVFFDEKRGKTMREFSSQPNSREM